MLFCKDLDDGTKMAKPTQGSLKILGKAARNWANEVYGGSESRKVETFLTNAGSLFQSEKRRSALVCKTVSLSPSRLSTSPTKCGAC